MRASRVLLVALAMAAGLLALAIGLRGPYAHFAARHWRKQLASVPDDQAAVLIAQVVELGEPGIPVLVEALGSERESVARAGKQALTQQLSRWQARPSQSSSRKQAVLAEALAQRVADFGPTGRRDAAGLAKRILLWLPDSSSVDRSQVIHSCQRVFQVTGADESGPAGSSLAAERPSRTDEPEDARHGPPPSEAPREFTTRIVQLSRLPGGGLPVAPLPLPEVPPGEGELARLAESGAHEPRRLPVLSAAKPLNPLRQPGPLPAPPEHADSPPDPRDPFILHGQPEATLITPLSSAEPHEQDPREQSGDLTGAETVDLMRYLCAEDTSTAGVAEAELTRRGFSAVHLELARRLFDPDPEVRKQLAGLLPGLRSVDPAPWLLRLSGDPSAEVRLAAITVMATTGDPALLEQVEQIARQDPDPRIRRQAERIAGQRGTRRR